MFGTYWESSSTKDLDTFVRAFYRTLSKAVLPTCVFVLTFLVLKSAFLSFDILMLGAM